MRRPCTGFMKTKYSFPIKTTAYSPTSKSRYGTLRPSLLKTSRQTSVNSRGNFCNAPIRTLPTCTRTSLNIPGPAIKYKPNQNRECKRTFLFEKLEIQIRTSNHTACPRLERHIAKRFYVGVNCYTAAEVCVPCCVRDAAVCAPTLGCLHAGHTAPLGPAPLMLTRLTWNQMARPVVSEPWHRKRFVAFERHQYSGHSMISRYTGPRPGSETCQIKE